jgi:hypothetical protein
VADRVDALAEQLENDRAYSEAGSSAPDLSAATLARSRRRCDDGDFGRDCNVSRGRKRLWARFAIRPGFPCSSPSGSLLFTIGALLAFLIEMLLASRGIRDLAASAGEPEDAPDPPHDEGGQGAGEPSGGEAA